MAVVGSLNVTYAFPTISEKTLEYGSQVGAITLLPLYNGDL